MDAPLPKIFMADLFQPARSRRRGIGWRRPQFVRPGDVLTVELEVLALTPSRSRPGRGTIILRSTTLNQHGEAVQILTARLVVPRRPAGAQP